jgi:hypothetical protein
MEANKNKDNMFQAQIKQTRKTKSMKIGPEDMLNYEDFPKLPKPSSGNTARQVTTRIPEKSKLKSLAHLQWILS